jgi:hypothetical protein
MANNLNPGADATLVGVAYRAAVANAPADYSGTLEKVAEGYEKTMEAQSEMWGNIATLGANIGGEMIANAEERTAYAAKAATLNPDDYQFLVDEMYANKDAQKDLGFFGGRFGDRETRQERAELKLKQQELFAEIDLAAESIKAGTDAVANGLYDSTLNEDEAEKVNAIIKSGLKDKHTENRNYAKLSRDEKTGELIYTLYDSDTDEPTMLNGVPQTMTIKEFNKSISNNVKDVDNATGTNMATIENSMANIGVKSKDGVLNDKDKQLALNQLNNMLKTDTDWRRAMRSKWGLSGTSFVEDLSTKGKVSSIIYGQMAQALGLSGDAQIPAEGVFEGIEDTDGTLGLSLDEVNASYGTYVKNIINMKDPEASKDAFRAVFSDRMDEAHTYGYGNRSTGSGSTKNPFTTGVSFKLWDEDEGKYVTKNKSKDELFTQRNQVFKGSSFEGVYGDYYWEGDTYKFNGEPISRYDILVKEKLIQSGDDASELGGSNLGKASPKEEKLEKLESVIDVTKNDADIVKDIADSDVLEGTGWSVDSSRWDGERIRLINSKGELTKLEITKDLAQKILDTIDPLNPNN